MDLRKKKIVITGVASGIGKETASEVKRAGAQVIGIDFKEARDIDIFIKGDLSKKASIDQIIEQLPEGIDGLANIAGLPPTAPAEAVMKVNFVGLKYLTTSLISKLAYNAAIVNLASLAGVDWPKSVPAILESFNLDFDGVRDFNEKHKIEGARSYFFSKEALIGWTIKNRWAWRDRGIWMNTISPGPVDTPILGDFLKTLGERAEEDTKIMDRPGRPSDIAPVVAFLRSDQSAWIRGANIPVNGGMNQHILVLMYKPKTTR